MSQFQITISRQLPSSTLLPPFDVSLPVSRHLYFLSGVEKIDKPILWNRRPLFANSTLHIANQTHSAEILLSLSTSTSIHTGACMNAAILFCFILFVSFFFFFFSFFFLIFLSIPFFKLEIGLNFSIARRILYKGPSTYSLYPRLTLTGRLGGGGKAGHVSAGHFWTKAN